MEFLSSLLMASDENQHGNKLLVSELLAQHTTSAFRKPIWLADFMWVSPAMHKGLLQEQLRMQKSQEF